MKLLAAVLAAAALPLAAQEPALRAFASDSAFIAHLARIEGHAPPPAGVGVPTEHPAPPSGPHAVVHGRVTDPGGAPLAGVTVYPHGIPAGAVTLADGSYRVYLPAAQLAEGGGVTVSAARIGARQETAQLTVAAGDSVTWNPVMHAAAILLEGMTVTAAGARQDRGASITNVQHAGVDEGGIVKRSGRHLVILRRGRLFTVEVAGRALRPVDVSDAFGPLSGAGTWYDELLVSGEQVVVIGYSYRRGGTEIVRFRLDPAGGLHYRGTHVLRSSDYYSSRNYASRLVGDRLILYAPVPVWPGAPQLEGWMPAGRAWRGDAGEPFRRTLPASRVYASGDPLHAEDRPTLHTLSSCDLSRPELACEASAVLGPAGRVFYVSPTAVYVWTTRYHGRARDEAPSTLYRLPLDGAAPRALAVHGSPIDPFSFLESDDRHLNVLVRADGGGEGMWRAEGGRGELALLRVPLARFGGGDAVAPSSAYTLLPRPAGGGAVQNRFVGGHLLYGTGAGWGEPREGGGALFVVRWRDGRASELALEHAADRIEALGDDALVVGADRDDLHFTGIRLGSAPRPVQRYVHRGAAQGETRSHGFFYRDDGPGTGILGLPVTGAGRAAWRHLHDESAAVVFLRNGGRGFRPLGELGGRPHAEDDECIVSCVDWYGNSRPIFMEGRIFALLGYEIVEGVVIGDAIREVRRVTFAPTRVARTR